MMIQGNDNHLQPRPGYTAPAATAALALLSAMFVVGVGCARRVQETQQVKEPPVSDGGSRRPPHIAATEAPATSRVRTSVAEPEDAVMMSEAPSGGAGEAATAGPEAGGARAAGPAPVATQAPTQRGTAVPPAYQARTAYAAPTFRAMAPASRADLAEGRELLMPLSTVTPPPGLSLDSQQMNQLASLGQDFIDGIDAAERLSSADSGLDLLGEATLSSTPPAGTMSTEKTTLPGNAAWQKKMRDWRLLQSYNDDLYRALYGWSAASAAGQTRSLQTNGPGDGRP